MKLIRKNRGCFYSCCFMICSLGGMSTDKEYENTLPEIHENAGALFQKREQPVVPEKKAGKNTPVHSDRNLDKGSDNRLPPPPADQSKVVAMPVDSYAPVLFIIGVLMILFFARKKIK